MSIVVSPAAGDEGQIGPAIRPSVEIEGAEWLVGFDQVAAGGSGIVPYVTNRAAFVKAELAKGDGKGAIPPR